MGTKVLFTVRQLFPIEFLAYLFNSEKDSTCWDAADSAASSKCSQPQMETYFRIFLWMKGAEKEFPRILNEGKMSIRSSIYTSRPIALQINTGRSKTAAQHCISSGWDIWFPTHQTAISTDILNKKNTTGISSIFHELAFLFLHILVNESTQHTTSCNHINTVI